MRKGFAAVLLAGASIALLGCWSTSFHANDPGYQGIPTYGEPAVYLTHLPTQPFRAVGIIVVDGPGGSSVEEAVPRAVDKGKEVGCQLIIWRKIVPDITRADRPLAVLAQVGPGLGVGGYNTPPGGTVGGSERPGKHHFVCGVWTSTAAPGT